MLYAETLIDSLANWARATGEQPTEIVLPTKSFLNVAADMMPLGRFLETPPEGARRRQAYGDVVQSFVDPKAKLPALREVWVGDSFTVQGPCGPVLIREAK